MMALRMMRTAAAAGTVVLAAALAACQGTSVQSGGGAGPFAGPRQPGTECIGLRGARVISDGFDAVRNKGPVTVVIDKMALADEKGLRLIAAYAVRTQGELFGLQRGYPPGHVRLPGWHWDQRQDVT